MRVKSHLWYAIPLLLVVLIVSCASWALYTQTGTNLLLKGVRSAMSGTLEIREVTGTAGHSLRMEGIAIRLEYLTVVVDAADLEWHPLYIVTGKLAITGLTATVYR